MTHESHFNGDTLTLTSPRGSIVLSQGQCASIVIMAEKNGPVGSVREAHAGPTGSIPINDALPSGDETAESVIGALIDQTHPDFSDEASGFRAEARAIVAAIRAGKVPRVAYISTECDGPIDAARTQALEHVRMANNEAMRQMHLRQGAEAALAAEKATCTHMSGIIASRDAAIKELERTVRYDADSDAAIADARTERDAQRGIVLAHQKTIDQLRADLDHAETKWHEAEACREEDGALEAVQSLAKQLMETSDALVKQNAELKDERNALRAFARIALAYRSRGMVGDRPATKQEVEGMADAFYEACERIRAAGIEVAE
jgi:hypothetical protein